jgi:hypothetical protein
MCRQRNATVILLISFMLLILSRSHCLDNFQVKCGENMIHFPESVRITLVGGKCLKQRWVFLMITHQLKTGINSYFTSPRYHQKLWSLTESLAMTKLKDIKLRATQFEPYSTYYERLTAVRFVLASRLSSVKLLSGIYFPSIISPKIKTKSTLFAPNGLRIRPTTGFLILYEIAATLTYLMSLPPNN